MSDSEELKNNESMTTQEYRKRKLAAMERIGDQLEEINSSIDGLASHIEIPETDMSGVEGSLEELVNWIVYQRRLEYVKPIPPRLAKKPRPNTAVVEFERQIQQSCKHKLDQTTGYCVDCKLPLCGQRGCLKPRELAWRYCQDHDPLQAFPFQRTPIQALACQHEDKELRPTEEEQHTNSSNEDQDRAATTLAEEEERRLMWSDLRNRWEWPQDSGKPREGSGVCKKCGVALCKIFGCLEKRESNATYCKKHDPTH